MSLEAQISNESVRNHITSHPITSHMIPSRHVTQVSLEGQISKESVRKALGRGEAPSGDLIPWTLSQQFQENDFPTLSGARVVRIAVHPDLQHMGYGSRAIEQLTHYYSGHLSTGHTPASTMPKAPPPSSTKKAAKKAAAAAKTPEGAEGEGGGGSSLGGDKSSGEAGGLLEEELAPRAALPPLLLTLEQRPAEVLDWFGSSFGLTQPLFKFWHRLGFLYASPQLTPDPAPSTQPLSPAPNRQPQP